LLGVEVGEQSAFRGDTVNVGRFVTHHAMAVGADIGDANVIAPYDQDVRFFRLCLCLCPIYCETAHYRNNQQHNDGSFFRTHVYPLS
jgi:hypothetical protein